MRLAVKTRPLEQWGISRELNERIKIRFDAEGIEIPFPQRTVWHRTEDGRPRTPYPVPGMEAAVAVEAPSSKPETSSAHQPEPDSEVD